MSYVRQDGQQLTVSGKVGLHIIKRLQHLSVLIPGGRRRPWAFHRVNGSVLGSTSTSLLPKHYKVLSRVQRRLSVPVQGGCAKYLVKWGYLCEARRGMSPYELTVRGQNALAQWCAEE